MKIYSIQELKEISKIMRERNIDLKEAREKFDINSRKRYNIKQEVEANKTNNK